MTATDAPDRPAAEGGPAPRLTMGIDPYEKNWMRVSILLRAAFFVTVTNGGFLMGC